MLNFKAALTTKVTNKQPTIYFARYINEQWYVKVSGILYPIQVPDYMTATVLYSLPSNPQHEEWTKRTVKLGTVNILANIAWSTLYHGMKLKGKLIDGKFIITK